MNKNVAIAAKNKQYTLTTWKAQKSWQPMTMTRSKGVYFWDADDKKYMDWSSQLVNVNVGHSHPRVVKAIQDQASKLCFAMPSLASEPRGQLGEALSKVTPKGHTKTFFTLGGADSNENAMKMARMYTGRQKVIGRYRAYHGSTFGAMSASGDPRKGPSDPGVPWTVHVHDPDTYRSPLYQGRSQEEGDALLIAQIAQTIEFEGPETIAAIILEGYSGTSGILQGGEVFWRGIQNLCDKHGIMLIIDEVMSGFGRTGRWFGVDHYPYVKPDFLVMAKGLTSGYIPMGGISVSDRVAEYFEENTLHAGLTYSAHTLACAAAIATLEVYHEENLIEHANEMGKVLRAGLLDLAEGHRCVGDVRGTGLLQVLDLVKSRETREPMSGFNQPQTEPMLKMMALCREKGLSAFSRWNWLFSAPPLVATEEQIQWALEILDEALNIADEYVTD
ncbi:MAG: aminotransferase class III-fold pyridoxal phosphate-dependent enzyme [Chloroflexota bacterium]